MPLNYGVLKGTVAGHLRDADDDHYQILVRAGQTMHRIASNVKSSAPHAPSTLLFQSLAKLPEDFIRKLRRIAPGFTKLPPQPKTLALDYVRGGLVTPALMKEVPPDLPGQHNDLKDKLEDAVVRAVQQAGSVIYAFGAKWGPENNTRDQYFRFLPGNGIHDIHMNQGNSGTYRKDNGIYHDGGLVFSYPQNQWLAFFFAFQSQTFHTDEGGNPIGVGRDVVRGKSRVRKSTTRKSRTRVKRAARSRSTKRK